MGRKGSSTNGKYRPLPLSAPSLSDDENDAHDDHIMSAVRSQQSLIERQDESLDFLGQSAQRLGVISKGIGDELKVQNMMIDELGDDLDQAESNIASVTKKTAELIAKTGGCETFSTILCLVVVVIVLFFLIVYV